MEITLTVNGVAHQVAAGAGRSLLEVLRDDLGLTGAKFGCGEGACGACTVLAGRRPVQSCVTAAAGVAGQRITTVEGLAEDGGLHPVQQAWLETGALQCGYCTPGWLMGTAALLAGSGRPSDERIDSALAGHICRCCTYPRIRRAVHRAADLMDRGGPSGPVPAGGAAPPGPAVLPGPAVMPGPAWDSLPLDEESFFAVLPDGLVALAEDGPGGDGGWSTSTRAWVHVGTDGLVTAFTGKIEEGQGTRTALALLTAEELRVPPSAVAVVMGNTCLSPFDMGTFGSRSMPDAGPRLRRAAAAARRVLREAAAERFGLRPSDLTLAGGRVAGPDGAPGITYGELLSGVRRLERAGPGEVLTDPAAWRAAGHHTRAAGGHAAVTGAKVFPADLALEGMRHGCVLRAPAYGARLRQVDASAAAAMAEVQVIHDGDLVGAVAAGQRTAREAAAAIRADWDLSPQPARGELHDFLRSHPVTGEGWNRPLHHEVGDVEAALAAGPSRLDASYTTAYIAHAPLEPRSALARWESGRLTVWVGTSTPFRARSELAAALGVPESRIQVIVPDFGGGFGGKHGATVALEAAKLARGAGTAVKVSWSREEEFRWGYLRPAAVIDVASSASGSGELTGWSFTNINSGPAGIMTPYRVPAQRIVYQPADSPLPQGSYRALAATANHFARESHMDEMAHRLGADPLAFRLAHLADGRLAAAVRTAASRIGWDGQRRGGRPDGHGIGLAAGAEKDGRVATAAEVAVDPDGTLHVLRLVTAFDCGAVVNPDGLANQVEGATVMALGGALFEQIDFAGGRILNASLSAYRVPRLPDVPAVEAVLIDQPGQPPAGGGETPMVAVAPALANAIFAATGRRLRSMPLAPSGTVPLARA